MLTVGSVIAALAHLVASVAVLAPTSGYTWPLTPAPAVQRGYEAPPARWAAGHRGADLLGRPGQAVSAAGAGVIAFQGRVAGRGVLSIQHSNGWRTTYEPVVSAPAVGTAVAAGDQVGVLDSNAVHSHCSPQVCLHWGLITAPDTYRDPLSLLMTRTAILIPLH